MEDLLFSASSLCPEQYSDFSGVCSGSWTQEASCSEDWALEAAVWRLGAGDLGSVSLELSLSPAAAASAPGAATAAGRGSSPLEAGGGGGGEGEDTGGGLPEY